MHLQMRRAAQVAPHSKGPTVAKRSFTVEEEYRRMQCSECGVTYFFPEAWADNASKHGKSWQCPNGHGQWFGESPYEKMRRENERMKQQAAQKDDELAAARKSWNEAEKRAKAVETRARAAVCPCCNRSFKQLREHMRRKHPEHAII